MLIADDETDPLDPMAADLIPPGDRVSVRSRTDAFGNRQGAVLLPSSAGRLTPAQHDLLSEMQHTALDVAELQAALRDVVWQARRAGVSWALVGWSVGLTGEGARTRYGEEPPPVRPASTRSSSTRSSSASAARESRSGERDRRHKRPARRG